MTTKKLAVTDPNGNPILTQEEAQERFGDGINAYRVPGAVLPPEAETGLPELGGLTPSQMRSEAPAEPAEPRYPKNPADWRAPHYMGLFGRISRAWDACPDELKPNLMTMILPLFSEKR